MIMMGKYIGHKWVEEKRWHVCILLPPVTNIPGAAVSHDTVHTLAATLGGWKVMITDNDTVSTSLTPLQALATRR